MSLPSLTLEQLTAVMKGKLVVGNKISDIPLVVGGLRKTSPASITFLTKNATRRNALNQLVKHHVHCVVTTNPNSLPVNKYRKAGIAVIKVSNLLRSYMALAGTYRRFLDIPFVQVIGSAGKTTTKEMIGAVLAETCNPMISVENRNSPFSVAHHILSINASHRSAVIEAGMLRRGMLSTSASMIKPSIAVITSIQRAHLLRLKSIQNIIAAKAEILRHMNANSVLILNGEDENIKQLPLHRFKGQVLRYGFSSEFDLWASDIKIQGFGTSFIANGKRLKLNIWINTFGKYNVGNALAAILVGLQLGLNSNEIIQGLAKFQPLEGRLKVHPGENGSYVINDNFNANPDSTRLLINELRPLAAHNPVTLVLGDMERPSNSTSKYAYQVHYEVGKEVAGVNFEQVLAIGKWGREYVRGAVTSGYPASKISYYPTVETARPHIQKLLAPGAIIVLKASIYTKLEQSLYMYSN